MMRTVTGLRREISVIFMKRAHPVSSISFPTLNNYTSSMWRFYGGTQAFGKICAAARRGGRRCAGGVSFARGRRTAVRAANLGNGADSPRLYAQVALSGRGPWVCGTGSIPLNSRLLRPAYSGGRGSARAGSTRAAVPTGESAVSFPSFLKKFPVIRNHPVPRKRRHVAHRSRQLLPPDADNGFAPCRNAVTIAVGYFPLYLEMGKV